MTTRTLFERFSLVIDENDLANDFFHGEYDFGEIGDMNEDQITNVFLKENIVLEFTDNHGGEGQGDCYWSVWKATDIETKEVIFVKFNGSYASYVGSEFDDYFEVEPKEVMVTKYHQKK